ncbi:MAG: hypothetical protein JSU63_21880 [Phycisphaerales bacterium]|nr:MAG: hypothetical protein JSU63_21880 [Phycisphaerales bacterium]
MRTMKWMLVVGFVSVLPLVAAGDGEYGGKDDAEGTPSVQESRRNSLKGLAAVYLVIEPLQAEAREAGLTTSQLRTDVELRLRAAKISVHTEEEGRKLPGNPYLYLVVNYIKAEQGFCIFGVRLAFIQNVFPQRDTSQLLRASTWSVSLSSYTTGTGVARIRESARDFADRFCNEYLTVNHRDEFGKPKPFDFAYSGPLDACKRWGKRENYIQQLIWDYSNLRTHFPQEEVLHAARQACKERVATESELADCRACAEEIITALYKDKEGL